MKHTKGPWKALGFCVYHGKNKPLCLCDTTYLSDVSSDEDRSTKSEISEEEAIANARLIAAAPDMFDALEEFVCLDFITGKKLEEDKQLHRLWTRARVTIKKAKGEL